MPSRGGDVGRIAITGASPSSKETPMTIEYVTLKTLRIAPENMRKTAAESDLGAFIASISAAGLLQNLVGYRDRDDPVAITAGGRPLGALNAHPAAKPVRAFWATMQSPLPNRHRTGPHP